MESFRNMLLKYRDLEIGRAEFDRFIDRGEGGKEQIRPIRISASHLIRLLERFRSGAITKEDLIKWVNTIWFSDWYTYGDEECDSIASVMDKLEELDEKGKDELTPEKIVLFIEALKNNREV